MNAYRRTTLIIVGCFAVLAGLGLSKILGIEISWWLVLFTPLLIFLKRKNTASLTLVIVIGLILGLWRGGVYVQKLNQIKDLAGDIVTVSATATTDAVYGKNQQIEFNVNKITSYGKPLAGSFKIAGFGPNMVYRGDTISATGKVYLTRGANQAGISFAQISVIGQDTSFVNKLTRKLSAGMQTALPEPMASFGLGLLVGQRSTLSKNILNELTLVGLVHIVAVSGYNLTIIVRAIGKLKLGSKFQRLAVSLVLIVGFVLITGFSASIVRAAIVSILSLWAWYYGRTIRPILLLAFTAALTSFIRPFYIWSDIGWYLSFLAFFGILSIAPLITKRLFRNSPKLVGSVIIETLCAEIMTLPLIMATFGQVSLVALLANLLVVPLVPLAMLAGTFAMTAGAWLPAISGWIAWPAKELLMYMLDIVHILARLPFANTQISISWVEMSILYVILGVFGLAIFNKIRVRKAL